MALRVSLGAGCLGGTFGGLGRASRVNNVARRRTGVGTEWLRAHEHGGPLMALADRVKQLRDEHRWPQGELAERIGADPAQISRYENSRIAPSADVLARLTATFDVSCDLPARR